MSKDESEYTVPPAEPERRRLVVQWHIYEGGGAGRWSTGALVRRADVEAWARVHAPEWLRAEESASTIAATHAETLDQLDAAIKRAEKAEGGLANLRDCIETNLSGFGGGLCNMVREASWEVQSQVDAARDAEDERDRAVERAKVAEADRGSLMRVAKAARVAMNAWRVGEALDALPEHIRREL